MSADNEISVFVFIRPPTVPNSMAIIDARAVQPFRFGHAAVSFWTRFSRAHFYNGLALDQLVEDLRKPKERKKATTGIAARKQKSRVNIALLSRAQFGSRLLASRHGGQIIDSRKDF